VVVGLRSLLRFLQVEGMVGRDLAVAVPSVAKWRLASLVRALDASFVARLVESCDRRSAIGRRDAAARLLTARRFAPPYGRPVPHQRSEMVRMAH
jgi:integrase/recombinase XerD